MFKCFCYNLFKIYICLHFKAGVEHDKRHLSNEEMEKIMENLENKFPTSDERYDKALV